MNIKGKSYFDLVIFAGIYIALIVLIITPLFNRINSASEELLAIKEEAPFFEEKTKISELRNQVQELEPDLERLELSFVDPGAPIEFVNFLKELSLNSNVQLDISSADFKEPEESEWNYFVFKLELGGSFTNVARFIEKIENSSYWIEIDQVNMKKAAISEEELLDSISTSLSIKVFTK